MSLKEGNKNSNGSPSCLFQPHCVYEHVCATDTEEIELFEVKEFLEKCIIIHVIYSNVIMVLNMNCADLRVRHSG